MKYEEITFFDMGKTPLSIKGKKVRLIELFAGIGSQLKALQNIGTDVQSWKVIEWDKYAIASYNAIFGTDYKTQDICKIHASDLEIVDTDKYTYIMTYSFPCTDLSLAGKMAGMSKADWKKGKSTRSGLLWEVERLLKECDELPQILLMENVPQVIGKKNFEDFKLWLNFLESKGYTNKYQLLNRKDYGVRQNRNRCFMVSWLGDHTYKFPAPVPLELRLKDYLEDEVDEKYYLNNSYIERLRADDEFMQKVREEIRGE